MTRGNPSHPDPGSPAKVASARSIAALCAVMMLLASPAAADVPEAEDLAPCVLDLVADLRDGDIEDRAAARVCLANELAPPEWELEPSDIMFPDEASGPKYYLCSAKSQTMARASVVSGISTPTVTATSSGTCNGDGVIILDQVISQGAIVLAENTTATEGRWVRLTGTTVCGMTGTYTNQTTLFGMTLTGLVQTEQRSNLLHRHVNCA